MNIFSQTRIIFVVLLCGALLSPVLASDFSRGTSSASTPYDATDRKIRDLENQIAKLKQYVDTLKSDISANRNRSQTALTTANAARATADGVSNVISVSGSTTTISGGTINLNAQNSVNVNASNAIALEGGNQLSLDAGNQLSLEGGNTVNVTAGTNLSLSSANATNLIGGTVLLGRSSGDAKPLARVGDKVSVPGAVGSILPGSFTSVLAR